MDPEIAQRLIALNKEFYQNLAAPFSASRHRLQPGVLRVLEGVPSSTEILDLGCGNGGVARELARRGHQGQYVGADFSEELIRVASLKVEGLQFTFIQADLTSADWNLQPPLPNLRFDFIFAFAVLHHLPSRELRLIFLRQVSRLMAPAGQFVLSNWQFLSSPRLQARIQPWSEIGLSDDQVDQDDYLLDWRSEGQGLRYVHHFNPENLAALAVEASFQVEDEFLSDGKTGNLARYQKWIPANL
ncbi:MAG: class I SAM-dependent methyltransferase [Chloroflexi bacterium]|nr:class I SAM-dependent methyltransferase [Chloroflexota bacterium]